MKPWEIVSDVLKLLGQSVKVGTTTKELNVIGEKRIRDLGGIPCNLNYKPDWARIPFPAAICISANDTIVHGIPSDYILKEGDLVNFDLGVEKDGVFGDGALTVGVGKLENKDERLLYYARKTLDEAIKIVKAGVKIKEISRVIENFSKTRGYEPNIAYGGHTIGKEMHEEPFIHNVVWSNLGEEELKVGQMICIEPIITLKGGDNFGVVQSDGWTVKTRDGKKSAYFEHQLLVTENGCEILTTHI